jgi:serine/threonine protein kinase
MMLYNKPPYFPTKADGLGIPGITKAVTERTHKFDENVKVSPECRKFINDCLKKNMKDRPTTLELLEHEWFEGLYQSNVSRLRTEMIKGSISGENETEQ